jgi:hypothetical protein
MPNNALMSKGAGFVVDEKNNLKTFILFEQGLMKMADGQ